jgi:hypothetical protein
MESSQISTEIPKLKGPKWSVMESTNNIIKDDNDDDDNNNNNNNKSIPVTCRGGQ